MKTKHRIPLQVYLIALAALLSISEPACHSQSNPQEQKPTAEEIRQHEEAYKNTMQQVDKLTSGYGKSMQYVPPSTGYDPKKDQRVKQSVPPIKSQSQPQPQK